jgi:hypothetical protein
LNQALKKKKGKKVGKEHGNLDSGGTAPDDEENEEEEEQEEEENKEEQNEEEELEEKAEMEHVLMKGLSNDYELMSGNEEGILPIPALMTRTSHDEILIDLPNSESTMNEINPKDNLEVETIEIMQYQSPSIAAVAPPITVQTIINETEPEVITNEISPLPLTTSSFMNLESDLMTQQSSTQQPSPHLTLTLPPSDSSSESDSEDENGKDGSKGQGKAKGKEKEKKRKHEKCDCVNSKMFPHRRGKCLLRSKRSKSAKKDDEKDVQEIIQSAQTSSSGSHIPSLTQLSVSEEPLPPPVNLRDLPIPPLAPSAPSQEMDLSDSSESDPEDIDAIVRAAQRKKGKERCDCINSTLFPHRRKKCLLKPFNPNTKPTQRSQQNELLSATGAAAAAAAAATESSFQQPLTQEDLLLKLSPEELELYFLAMSSSSSSSSSSEGEEEEGEDYKHEGGERQGQGQQGQQPVETSRSTKKNKKCDCLNSTLFPHRRKKCFWNRGIPNLRNLPSKISKTFSVDSDHELDSDDEIFTSTPTPGTGTGFTLDPMISKHLHFLLMALFAILLLFYIRNLRGDRYLPLLLLPLSLSSFLSHFFLFVCLIHRIIFSFITNYTFISSHFIPLSISPWLPFQSHHSSFPSRWHGHSSFPSSGSISSSLSINFYSL